MSYMQGEARERESRICQILSVSKLQPVDMSVDCFCSVQSFLDRHRFAYICSPQIDGVSRTYLSVTKQTSNNMEILKISVFFSSCNSLFRELGRDSFVSSAWTCPPKTVRCAAMSKRRGRKVGCCPWMRLF